MLCGRSRCPVLLRFYYWRRAQKLIDSLSMNGSSPPSVFVGRIGYPHVAIGPLLPGIRGDTSILDMPEDWLGKSIDEIVDFRSKLVRGKYRVHIQDFNGKIPTLTQELALSSMPMDMEAWFTKKPTGGLVFDDRVQPVGPSAPLKKIRMGNVKIDQRIEKAWMDIDLSAKGAVLQLYNNRVEVSRIQRAFSVGAFGVEKKRKFVPTRWSITAIDSMISKDLRETVKDFPLINEYRIYETNSLDNRFIVLMTPFPWSYELIEAWYPGTTWNWDGKHVVIYSSSEPYRGRTRYAEIGGCYYAGRLAVAERLKKERRQASTIIFREAHPGYIMPVGVWNVREAVRDALRKKPILFDGLKASLSYISKKLAIGIGHWVEWSKNLKDLIYQRRIGDYEDQ